jgi:hypothetical protein
LVYRAFCRIDGERVPDGKTLIRLARLLDEPVLKDILARLVGLGRERRLIRGRRLRVDTTATTVSYSLKRSTPQPRTWEVVCASCGGKRWPLAVLEPASYVCARCRVASPDKRAAARAAGKKSAESRRKRARR